MKAIWETSIATSVSCIVYPLPGIAIIHNITYPLYQNIAIPTHFYFSIGVNNIFSILNSVSYSEEINLY